MSKLPEPYKTYHFPASAQDPVIGEVETLMNGHSIEDVCSASGVAKSTIRRWYHGKKKTKRPKHATVMAIVHACGYRVKYVRQR